MSNKACDDLRKLYERHVNNYWGDAWDKMTRRQEFLAGDRYVKDEGEFNKDRRRIQIRGMETQDTIRHMVAKLTERPRSVEARAIDRIDDPFMSEAVAAIVEWDLGKPSKRFDDRVEGAIIDACSMGLGVIWNDLVAPGRYGPYADRVPRRIDPRNVMIDECYEDPHEPGCGFFFEKQRLPVAEIHATWPKAKWVKPDRAAADGMDKGRTGYPILQYHGRNILRRSDVDDDKATIWKCWYKNDYSKRQKPGPVERELEPGDQSYLCSACGYQTDKRQDLEAMGEGMDTAPVQPGACPDCGGDMELLTHEKVSAYEAAYQNGKRLLIIAPFQHEGDEKPIYDGKWPVPTMQTFPLLWLTEYQIPGEPVGKCEVDNAWDQQVASDQLLTHAIRQVFDHRLYWQMPTDGIYNWQGERFGFRDDDYNVMYVDATKAAQWGVENMVKPMSGIGLDPNFGTAFQLVQQKLTQYRPSGDIGLSEDASKDIAVGTVEALERQGETPVEHFNRRKNRALSSYYTSDWQMIRKTVTADELMRLRLEGTDVLVDGVAGEDLPEYDLWIEDTPRFAGIQKEKLQAFTTLIQAGDSALQSGKDPQLAIELLGDLAGYPKSSIRKAQKLFSNAPQLGPDGMPLPVMPGGGGGVPPDAGEEEMLAAQEGLDAGGMEPLAAA